LEKDNIDDLDDYVTAFVECPKAVNKQDLLKAILSNRNDIYDCKI
jgi:hypothetical protein